MRTGKLSISRGHQLLAERPAPAQAPVRPVSFTPCQDTGELHLIQVRLNALERLSRLVEQGVISLDEFKLEKSLVLRLTGEELLLTKAAPPATPQARASLAGRIPRWTLVLMAPLVAFGASFWAAPAETMAWVELLSG
jgi:hypothetical protein